MNNTILYLLTVMIWGSTWYAITFQTGAISPVLSVSYRFILAAFLLFVIVALTRGKDAFRFTSRQHGLFFAQGFFLFSLNYITIYYASMGLTSGLVAILYSTVTLMNIFNQRLFFKIPVNKQVCAGSLIGLIGISLVFWPEIETLSLKKGITDNILLCLLSTYIASLGNMMSIRISRENVSVMGGNSFSMAYGGIICFIIALFLGLTPTLPLTIPYLGSLLYLAIFGSALAFWSYLTLLRNIGADKASYAAVLFPLVALTISTLLEGYEWTFTAFIGLLITLIGNIIAMAHRKKPKKDKIHV